MTNYFFDQQNLKQPMKLRTAMSRLRFLTISTFINKNQQTSKAYVCHRCYVSYQSASLTRREPRS